MSAVTQNEYTGNGSTTTYSFTFPYLKESDIKVSLDSVVTTDFSLPNATTIQFNTAPNSGVKIKIFRETSVDNLTATFYAGSAIKSEDLNDNFTQNLFVTQEVNQRAMSSLGATMTGELQIGTQGSLTFEGSTDDANETTIAVTDPTADRTITLPNETGEVVLDTLPSAKIFVGDSNGKVSEATVTGDIAISNTGATTIQPNAVESGMIGENQVTTSEVNDSLANANIASDAAIVGTKISPDFGSQNITTTGTINSLTTTELAILDGATVTKDELNILDGVTATKDEINVLDGIPAGLTSTELGYVDGVTSDIQPQLDGKQASATDLTTLSSMQTGAATELASLTQAELDILDGATVTTDQLNRVDATSSIQTQLDGKQPLDTDLTTLSGMQSGTASKLAEAQTLTADINDLNIVDGMSKQTGSGLTNVDTSFPTSAAVVSYVAGQIAPLGGLEVVATEVAFPNTQPSSGVVISISDAGGTAFGDGTGGTTAGQSLTGRTVGGSTVTINNAPSSLNGETLVAGVGLMVSSTGSGQIYNYHKILGKEDDIKQLSDDINDFNARYRVGTASDLTGLASGTLDGGDLFFNTTTGKLLVYNNINTAWEEAQSIGNFFISTFSEAFDGSRTQFTISNAPANAQQIILSLNGVVQKPGTAFTLSSSTVTLASAPASGTEYFAVVMGSTVNIGTPSNNTVNTDILMSGAVTDAKVSSATSDRIAGSKISPDFGSQNVVTTGTLGAGATTIGALGVTGNAIISGGYLEVQDDNLYIQDAITHSADTNTKMRFPANDVISFETDGKDRFVISNAIMVVNDPGNDVDFRIEGDTNPNALFINGGTNHTCIGTDVSGYTGYADQLTVADTGNCGITIRSGNTSANGQGAIYFSDSSSATDAATYAGNIIYDHVDNGMRFATDSVERFRIGGVGQLGVGTAPSYGNAGEALVSQGASAAPQWAAVKDVTIGTQVDLTSVNGGSNTNYVINTIPNTAYHVRLVYADLSATGGSGGSDTPILRVGNSGGIKTSGYRGWESYTYWGQSSYLPQTVTVDSHITIFQRGWHGGAYHFNGFVDLHRVYCNSSNVNSQWVISGQTRLDSQSDGSGPWWGSSSGSSQNNTEWFMNSAYNFSGGETLDRLEINANLSGSGSATFDTGVIQLYYWS